MTVLEIFEKAIALIDGMTDAGAVDTTTTADYKARTPFLTNLLQSELIKTGDLTAKYEVAYSPMVNLLGDRFDMLVHETTDIAYETNGKVAMAYYFESDASDGSVLIQDYTGAWNTLATVTLTNSGFAMMPYKALVTPTSGATKSRIVFSGNYNYRYTNFGLFGNAFKTALRMFDYSPYVKITLPTTTYSIKEVIVETSPNVYQSIDDTKFEMDGTTLSMFIDRNFVGTIRVIYIPNPTKVTATALSETLQIDDYSCNIMAYGLATAFMNVRRDDYLASIFQRKFDELKSLSQYRKPKQAKKIQNKYGYF